MYHVLLAMRLHQRKMYLSKTMPLPELKQFQKLKIAKVIKNHLEDRLHLFLIVSGYQKGSTSAGRKPG